jgi:hypothetical protein
MTATRCFVTMPRDWDTTIGHRLVAFLNHIRLHVRVLRTRHVIALASYVSTIKEHGRRAREDLTMMVGIVPDSDQINHIAPLLTHR